MPDQEFWRRKVTIYLYHFEQPYKQAGHYLGSAEDLDQRAAAHAAGQGSKLMAAVVSAGIAYQLARTWEDVPRYHEVTLHKRKQNSVFCPMCSGDGAMKRGLFTPSKKKTKSRRGRR